MKVTICIPTYNYGHLIKDAIESVLIQDYDDYELLILDNNSTDNTEEVVKPFLHIKRIQYIKNAKNLGFTRNLNLGLQLAKGEYLVYLCADDYWLPEILRKEIEILDTYPDVVLVHTGYKSIYRINGQDIHRRDALLWPHGIHDGKRMVKYFFDNCVTFVWPMVRRKILQELGGFNEQLIMAPESHMWLRAAIEGNVGYIREPLYAFRYHGNNLGVELQKKGVVIDELLLFADNLLDYVREKDSTLYHELRFLIYNFPFNESYRWLLHSRTFMDSSYRDLLRNGMKIINKDPKKLIYPPQNIIRFCLAFLPSFLLKFLSFVKARLRK